MTKILVTGGAGYVGSHACKALALAGFTPVTYDNLSRGHAEAVKWGPLEKGDLADGDRLKAVIARHQPEAMLHFAAYAYVGESVQYPERYYRNNVAGSLTLLETMLETGIDALVFSSTCAVYGVPQHIPLREDHPVSPVNPYGASKLMVERMLRDISGAHGMRYFALRYFNAAGADPDTEIGEVHDPETHLIPLVLDAAAKVRPEIMIFGDDYQTPDGTCIRDYIHVCDLADAHVLALRQLLEGDAGDICNLGNGNGYSVLEVIETAERVTGVKIPRRTAPRREGDPLMLIADPARAVEKLGWTPKHSALEAQVADAWRWHLACRQKR